VPTDPVPAIDLLPTRQILYQLPDRGPLGAVPAGEVATGLTIGYFAAFSDQERGGSTVLLDLEGARFDLRGSWAPTDGLTIGLDLPLIVYYDGVLDAVVEAVDRAVGTPSPLRKELGRNVYRFELESEGTSTFTPSPGHFGLGDLALEVRYQLVDEVAEGWVPDVSASGALELPTGDSDLAHGNGSVDLGAGVEIGRTLGDFRLSLALGLVVPGGLPDQLGPVSTHVAVSGLAAAGYRLADAWGLVAQVDYRQSPFDQSGLDVFGADSSELAVALRWAPPTGSLSVDAAFVEGLVNGASPDFSVVTSVTYRFSAATPAGD
jgi:hypothetical protein